MDQLYDGSAAVVAVSAFFIPVCIILTSLRLFVRWTSGTHGMDDYLLFAGLLLYLVSAGMCFPAAWNGVGAHSEHYTAAQEIEGLKYFFIFQDFYVWANIPAKASICLTMVRLSGDIRWMRWALYFMIFVIAGASLGTNIYLLTSCKPLSANWDKSGDDWYCKPSTATVTLGNAYSAITIAVDWTVALLPVILLWKVQLAWKQKLVVMGVLALGIFASTATIIRLKTLTAFANPDDYLYGLGPITVWTVTELGLAIIAASLVTLRPLVRRWFGSTIQKSSDIDDAYRNNVRRQHPFQRTGSNDSDIGLETMIHSEHHKTLQKSMGSSSRQDVDNESQSSIVPKNGQRDIMVTRTFRMG